MKILLLGANGFIGRHLFDFMQCLGYCISKADIASKDARDFFILDPVRPDFISLFSQDRWDVCINCSGAASVPESFINPGRDFTLNTVRIAEMLEGLRRVPPTTRFIHLSSAAVYGNPVKLPISENDHLKPVSPYGWHKLQAEEVCREYSAVHGLKTLSLRIFSAYGPGLRKQLFWDVYQKALKKQRVELFGTGTETRDFIFVGDIASCADIVIRQSCFDGRAVNVANGEAVSIKSAVSTLFNALGWEREIVFSGAGRLGDPSHWQADISYLNELGFSPSYSLKAGLEKVAEWMTTE